MPYYDDMPRRLTRTCDGDMCNNRVAWFEDDDITADKPLLCFECASSGNYPPEWDDQFRPRDEDAPYEEEQ